MQWQQMPLSFLQKKIIFFSYASYGTSQNPGKGPVKNRLLEVMVDYPTPSGDCKALDIKMIHNDFGGFNKFLGILTCLLLIKFSKYTL